MFKRCAMSSTSLWSFGGAPVVQRNRIRLPISDEPLIGPGCSPPVDLSYPLPFFEVGGTATGMVFPFWKTVVHCCTKSVLAREVAIVVMLGRTGICVYGGQR